MVSATTAHRCADNDSRSQNRTDSDSNIPSIVMKTRITDKIAQTGGKPHPSTIIKCAFTCQIDKKCEHWCYHNDERRCMCDDIAPDARDNGQDIKTSEEPGSLPQAQNNSSI
ncbi:hypothetical protein P879_10824 [Paragonimus westermani]|uniref:Uncharacterized protein n=1 Tax=Paragonimus westermani TaxID=34504 RepID=A0A8T0D7X7_9TREM|nr:hypothetical protein P879_10824 [Paragonimus westermani]